MPSIPENFITSDKELQKLIGNFNWEQTPLGNPVQWPQSLLTTLNIVASAMTPLAVWWGEALIQFYNNHFIPCLGEQRHPQAFGQPAANTWFQGPDKIEAIKKAVLRDGKALVIEDQLCTVHRDGKYENLYWTYAFSPVRDEQGKTAGIFLVCSETTPRNGSLKKLQEAQERTTLALDAAELGIFEIDLKTDAIITNKRFNEIYGFDHQATRQDYVSAYHPHDKPIRDQAVKRSAETGLIVFEVRILHSNGSTKWIRLHAKNFHDEHNQPVRLYGVVADITEERNIREQLANAGEELAGINEELRAANEEMAASNEELAESNSMLHRVNADLDNFIYTASHDLKAPFSNLEGLLNTLMSEVELKPDLSILKEMIDLSFLRFKNTLEHLTNISKLQREEAADKELLDLQEMTNDAMLDIQDQIYKSQAHISTRFDFRKINFSPNNLRSILYNLISNAVKYSAPERIPEINISSRLQGDYVVLEVADNGLGLSEKNLKVIFGMFKRAHDHVEGSGIGLFIVKKIVENAGGKIEVESEVGKGSKFMVYLKAEDIGMIE